MDEVNTHEFLTQRSCQSCIFWSEIKSKRMEDDGFCRRYPPQFKRLAEWYVRDEGRDFSDAREGYWPVTYRSHWCGEWVFDPRLRDQ